MNNLAKRIIPCLDIHNGRVVKGVNFESLKDAGDPVEVAKRYNDEGADEIIFLDIQATNEGRKATLKTIEQVASKVFIPLSVGGGIKDVDDISRLLNAGCDKVTLNSSALQNEELISLSAKKFGSSCIVIAVDAKLRSDGSIGVFSHGGSKDSFKDMLAWCLRVQELGAGEIILTSIDKDGTKSGYDLEKINIIKDKLKIPLIASGGAGSKEHILEAFQNGCDGALGASIFHFKEVNILELKHFLKQNGVSIRDKF